MPSLAPGALHVFNICWMKTPSSWPRGAEEGAATGTVTSGTGWWRKGRLFTNWEHKRSCRIPRWDLAPYVYILLIEDFKVLVHLRAVLPPNEHSSTWLSWIVSLFGPCDFALELSLRQSSFRQRPISASLFLAFQLDQLILAHDASGSMWRFLRFWR